MRPRNEQGGELVVLGHGKVQLHLKDYPHKIEVFFKKKPAPPPCDPHHHLKFDELEWQVHRVHRGPGHVYTLDIAWNVHEIREIIWLAYF